MKTLCSAFILLLSFCVNAQSPSTKAKQLPVPCDSTSALNQEILDAVKPYVGKKVDRGECWDLAKLALDKTGAKWDGYMDFGKKIDWKKDCLQPGDILQFEKVEFSGTDKDKNKYTESFYHHTALVYAVHDDGTIELIHQNAGQSGKKVGVSPLNFADMKKGTIQAYRPVK